MGLVNAIRKWQKQTTKEIEDTEYLAEHDSALGWQMDGLIKGQRACIREIDQLLEDNECSAQEQ